MNRIIVWKTPGKLLEKIFYKFSKLISNFELLNLLNMIKKLLQDLFFKIQNERDITNKTKNAISIYFVEEVVEKRFGKPNYISSKSIKGYYDKYVEERDNKSGEPSNELKGLIAKYLGYKDFFDFENNNISKINKRGDGSKVKRNSVWFVWGFLLIISTSILYYKGMFRSKDCIVWKVDHYEKIDCNSDFSITMLKNLNIKRFKKIEVSRSTLIFRNGKVVIWYGKSSKGELEYFNSPGVHPITGKQLKPMTKYMVDKYIYKKN